MNHRASWRQSVSSREKDICHQLKNLSSGLRNSPVPLESIASRLGARIEETSRQLHAGNLRKDATGWIVAVNNSLSYSRQRFTIAHELAHILFIGAGLGRPLREGGYWILEQACDRIAAYILVPESLGPSGMLEEEDLERWMRDLTERWQLSPEAAAKCIAQRSANCRSVAGWQHTGRGPSFPGMEGTSDVNSKVVNWSLSLDDAHPWPGPGTHLDATRHPELNRLLVKYLARGHRVHTHGLGGILIGFRWANTFMAFRQDQQASPPSQMELPNLVETEEAANCSAISETRHRRPG